MQAATIQSQLVLLERESKDLLGRTESLRREQAEVARQCDAAGGLVEALTLKIREMESALQRCVVERVTAQEKTGILRAQETTLSEALNELRVRVATEQQKHEGLRRQRQPMDARRTELAELIERRRREREEHRGRLARYASEADELAAQIEAALVDLAHAETEIETRRKIHVATGEEVAKGEAELQNQRQSLNDYHDRRSREESSRNPTATEAGKPTRTNCAAARGGLEAVRPRASRVPKSLPEPD